MMKSLERILKGIALTSLLALGSCGTAMKMAAPYGRWTDARAAATWVAAADGIQGYEHAKAARSNTTVNVSGGMQNDPDTVILVGQYFPPATPANKEDYVFACTSDADLNGDGCFGLDEYKDRGKTLYKVGDPVEFVIYNTSKEGELRFVFKDEKGNVLRDVADKNHAKSMSRTRDPPNPEKGLSEGKYTAEWYRDGVFLGKTEIEYRKTEVQ